MLRRRTRAPDARPQTTPGSSSSIPSPARLESAAGRARVANPAKMRTSSDLECAIANDQRPFEPPTETRHTPEDAAPPARFFVRLPLLVRRLPLLASPRRPPPPPPAGRRGPYDPPTSNDYRARATEPASEHALPSQQPSTRYRASNRTRQRRGSRRRARGTRRGCRRWCSTAPRTRTRAGT